jgi:membrane-associated phospholipid phosphatase
MDFLYENGIALITLFQRATWGSTPARIFTFLGSEDFFLLVLPAVYWCIDAALGIRIGFILLFGNILGTVFKLTIHAPRPYWISTDVKALSAEASFGAPSTHAQNAVGIWGVLAAKLGRTWAWIAAGMVAFLIGLSRLVLGVHFPHDVLLGWLLGGLTLWAFLALWEPVSSRIRGFSFGRQVALILATAAVALLVQGLLAWGLRDYVVPDAWMVNAARAGEPLPGPVSFDGPLTTAGTFIGLALGVGWLARRGGFRPSGPVWKRALCFLIGILGVLVLYTALRPLFTSEVVLLAYVLRLLRYALIGLWIAALAPFLFRWLHLVEQSEPLQVGGRPRAVD